MIKFKISFIKLIKLKNVVKYQIFIKNIKI